MAPLRAIAASTLLVSVSLFGLILAPPSRAATEVVTWFPFNIPAEGIVGNWVLADGSDVRHVTMAIDGTLYCYANPSGTSYTLFKSSDGGYSWAYVLKVSDSIVDIVTAPDNASYVYYATTSAVYRSNDAGSNFAMLPASPGGAGSGNVEITSITVTINNQSNRIIACGTRDADSGQYGGIYTLDDNTPFAWTSTSLIGYDVCAVAFSPGFAADRELVAVVTDETNTVVTTRIGDSAWGSIIGDATLNRNNSGVPTPVVARDAAIAFPEDYAATPVEQHVRFVAIDTGTGNGDVYRIESSRAPVRSMAIDLNIGFAYSLGNIDISSIAVTGSGATTKLMAGTAASTQTYFSSDSGRNWSRASKEPTGQSKTTVLMPPKSSGKAYAATCGTESALSVTADGGNTWNQLGLVDTRINRINDFAPSPNFSQDNTLFILTNRTGGKHSLWRSLNGGARWERVYSGTMPGVTAIDRIAISPRYDNTNKAVYIAGNSGGAPAIWQSTDSGQTFSRRNTYRPTSGASFTVDTWVVVNNTSLFIGSYDGTNGIVCYTTNGGLWYDSEIAVGNQSLNNIVVSPDYAQDKSLLVGNINGWVYWSNDEGKSFQSLPLGATSPPLTGNICVAFDPKFTSNRTVYAASDGADKGIYRFIIGKSSVWERIDTTLLAGSLINRLALSAGGTLYGANLKANGGMERSVNPTYSLGPSFEAVRTGLTDGATLSGLWLQGNQLWSVDTINSQLMSYIDSLNRPIIVTAPPDKAIGMGNVVNYTVRNISLEWKALSGTTSYHWQLDSDDNFTTVPAGFEGNTGSSSLRLPPLEPGTKYYWRVQATQPVSSPWSPTGSFTTCLSSETNAPVLISPAAGVNPVELRPVFQWSAVPGARSYEFLVATDASFTQPVIAKTGDSCLPATAWQCDTSLSYGTTYYWKVRDASSPSAVWSAVSAFITKPAPPPAYVTPVVPPSSQVLVPSAPAPSPSPALPPSTPAPAPTIPDWMMYVVGGLIAVIVMQLVIILALVGTIKRL